MTEPPTDLDDMPMLRFVPGDEAPPCAAMSRVLTSRQIDIEDQYQQADAARAQAMREAGRTCAAARSEAAALVSAASERAAAIVATATADGQRAAAALREEIRAAAAIEVRAETERALTSVAEALARLEAESASLAAEWAEKLAPIVAKAMKEIVAKTFNEEPGMIRHVVEQCLQDFSSAKRLVLMVHPHHADAARGLVDGAGPNRRWIESIEVRGDDTIPIGHVRILTSSKAGSDYSLDAAIDALAEQASRGARSAT